MYRDEYGFADVAVAGIGTPQNIYEGRIGEGFRRRGSQRTRSAVRGTRRFMRHEMLRTGSMSASKSMN